MNRLLARIGDEGKTLNAHKVANVQELLEYGVVQSGIALGADIVTTNIYLNTARVVLQLEERCATHNTAAHNTAGDAHLCKLLLVLLGEVFADLCSCGCHIVHSGRIGLNAQLAKCRKRLTTQEFLFRKFHHIFCCFDYSFSLRGLSRACYDARARAKKAYLGTKLIISLDIYRSKSEKLTKKGIAQVRNCIICEFSRLAKPEKPQFTEA